MIQSWGLPPFSYLFELHESFVDFTYKFRFIPGETTFTDFRLILAITLSYVAFAMLAPRIMKDREPFNLFIPRVVHNIILTLFSMTYTITLVYYMITVSMNYGVDSLYCDVGRHQVNDSPLTFWYYVFYLSKFYEFLDTAILILRKKKIIFLHAYHHFITVWICWVPLSDSHPMQFMTIVMNGLVHCFMYWYYLCATMGWSSRWKKYLTTFQIIQFILDMSVNMIWVYAVVVQQQDCDGTMYSFWFGQGVLVTFLSLFISFFIGQNFSFNSKSSSSSSSTKKSKKE